MFYFFPPYAEEILLVVTSAHSLEFCNISDIFVTLFLLKIYGKCPYFPSIDCGNHNEVSYEDM